jgi:mRNA interferase RelE/StbE
VSWVYRFDERALKDLKKLGRPAQAEIIAYLDDRVGGEADPRRFGKALKAELAGLWRYRVGD